MSFLFVLSLWLTIYSGQLLLHGHQEMFGEPATVWVSGEAGFCLPARKLESQILPVFSLTAGVQSVPCAQPLDGPAWVFESGLSDAGKLKGMGFILVAVVAAPSVQWWQP